MPFSGVHEMLMMGTASHHPALPARARRAGHQRPDLRGDVEPDKHGLHAAEARAGHGRLFAGLIGGLKAMFKSFVRGEISDLTSLIYDAREHAIGLIKTRPTRSAPTTWWASRRTSTRSAT